MNRILLVDDSPSILSIIKATLKNQPFDLVTATSARDALREAQQKPFDLVVTDLNMPGMDGLSLSEEIHRLPEMRNKPILVLTTESSHNKDNRERALQNVSGWMLKPFRPEQFIGAVRRLLQLN